MNKAFTAKLKYNNNASKLSYWTQEELNWIFNNSSFCDTNCRFVERIYVIKHNMKSRVLCKEHGDYTSFINIFKGYREYCSAKDCMDDDKTKEKRKKTCLARYGVDNIFKDTARIKAAIEKNNDGMHHSQTKEFKDKFKNTCLDRYGVTNPAKLESSKIKMKETCLERYGVEYAGGGTKGVNYWEDRISPESWGILQDKDKLKELNKTQSLTEISNELNVSLSLVWLRYKEYKIKVIRHKRSIFEKEIETYIKSLGVENILICDRQFGWELDIYLPDYNLAIEANGVLWHSESKGNKSANYHVKKTNVCKDNGISLLHIQDNEWLDETKRNIWKSVISSKIGNVQNKIFARKTKIVQISSKEGEEFFANNHLQGGIRSSIVYGLLSSDELVCVMSFSKTRFDKSADYELVRFCNKLNTTVVGGASRLLSNFKKNVGGAIVSYANRRWSDGGLYDTLGFDYVHTSNPGYQYTLNYHDMMSRIRFQKHKLKDKLELFDENLSEWENMKNNGYDRIWDCGNLKYIML